MPYLIALLLSATGVWFVHPYLVRFAFKYNVVDKPNARKLNRVPIPVLGGVGVFVGFVIALYVVASVVHILLPNIYIVVLLLMLGVGLFDDLRDLKPYGKFAAQILAVLLLYFVCDLRLDNLHGIFGIYEIPMVISLPLTLFACVGLINSLNLIDGIDGLSSGYSIVASILFAAWTYVQSCNVNLLIVCALIGALVPFFIYNVFGRSYKMFIGDAGSHLLGIIFCIVTLNVVNSPSSEAGIEAALIPFALAVLSHPVFDTLRVMTMRICKGHSPFKADKTHLHHALVEKGLTHLATTLTIVGLNLLVVGAWLVSYKCEMSATIQLLIVVMMSMLCIVLPYFVLTGKK